ncbi:MAG: YceI family protein, partial [Sphingomonadales bacterium]
DAEITALDGRFGFEAETTIKRSDFGIGFGIPMVSDEVKLKIAAGFYKN